MMQLKTTSGEKNQLDRFPVTSGATEGEKATRGQEGEQKTAVT